MSLMYVCLLFYCSTGPIEAVFSFLSRSLSIRNLFAIYFMASYYHIFGGLFLNQTRPIPLLCSIIIT